MITVTAGQSLRSAILNAPTTETVISVEAGAVFNETIELSARERSVPLVVQSSRAGELPPDKRVSPDDAGKMPKIIPPGVERAVKTTNGAHHYSFVGIEVTHDPTRDVHTLIALGDPAQTALEQIPHSLMFDRCFIHGHAQLASVRGIALNSANTDILNSHISDIHSGDVDSQAICGWAGPGPFRIINNYLEAAGENVMFGGADPKIAGLIPSDIEIRQNHFFKPFTWRVGHPTYAGKKWAIKNLLETKNARRLMVEGNVFENCWTDAQVGFAILIKCNNQDSSAPWSVTEDLLFQYNTVRAERGLNMLLIENLPKVSAIGKRIYIRHNFFDVEWTVFQGPNSGEDVQFEHNTWTKGGGNNFTMYGQVTKRFVFSNNLGPYVGFGIRGDGEGVGAGAQEGTSTFNAYSPGGWIAEGNVISGANPSQYPAKNFYPATWAEVQADDRYRLLPTSLYKGKATDGKDPGVDWEALLAAQAGTGVSLPTPGPSPIDPLPPADPTLPPSAPGTKSTTITDNANGVWTIGSAPLMATLRNGTHMAGGRGKIYKWLDATVYVLGTNDNWYRWTGSAWISFGSEPGAALPPVEPPPAPKPCSISASEAIDIPRNGFRDISIQLEGLTEAARVEVFGYDGQVSVTPTFKTASPASPTLSFRIKVKSKKQVRVLIFRCACGEREVRVNVV